MREHIDELDELDARVYAVTFESSRRIDRFQQEERLAFPILRDPDRAAYRSFGLGRRSVATIWGPAALWYYLRRLVQGEMPKRFRGSDRYQLGGDVILRRDGAGGWVYRSRNPSDRPPVAGILRVLKRGASSSG